MRKVKDFMTTSFIKQPIGITMSALQEQLKKNKWEAVVFYDNNDEPKSVISSKLILLIHGQQELTAEEVISLIPPLIVGEEDDVTRVIPVITKENMGILVKDKDGKISGVITTDILVNLIFEDWQRNQAQFDKILEIANESICIINDKEEVECWNPKSELLYNIKAKEILGQPIKKYFPNDMISQTLRERKVIKDSYHQPRESSHVLITSAPIMVGNKLIGSLSMERDIGDVVYLNEELTRTSVKVKQLKQELNSLSKYDFFAKIYGHSSIIKQTIEVAQKFAVTEAPVLIQGESGTGKELFARAIHEASNRSQQPFVAVNCGALPQMLFESEVFGYEGGAFTGALKEGKPGKFEQANRGTLFLDEIGELELGSQVKLLRALQDKTFYRIGGTRPIQVDVRIIAATNRSLEEMIKEGKFREDLYFRLNVATLSLPPLRERKEDIPELVYLLTRKISAVYQKDNIEFEPEVMIAFMRYNWSGNVRQLQNVLERLVILADEGIVKYENLPDELKVDNFSDFIIEKPKGNINLSTLTERMERKIIVDALKNAGNNIAEAARILGIPRSSLYYKMNILKIRQ